MGLDYIKGKSKIPWIKLSKGTPRNSEKKKIYADILLKLVAVIT